jgi:hypothetical protein
LRWHLYSGCEIREEIMRNSKLTMFGAVALGLTVGVVAPSPAWADVITVFDVSGEFDNGAALTGDVTIDVTAGDATAIDLTADSFHFGKIAVQFSQDGLYFVAGSPSPSSTRLVLAFPVASLVGYGGGALSTQTRVDDFLNGTATSLIISSVKPAKTAAVPELSTWAMMLLGFTGLGYAGYRQRQRLAGFKTV